MTYSVEIIDQEQMTSQLKLIEKLNPRMALPSTFLVGHLLGCQFQHYKLTTQG